MTYAVRHARWVPLYDARLDTGATDRKPALELVRRAEILQTTGEDWSNVALSVSTVRTARGGSAPDLNSLIVQYPPPAQPLAGAMGTAKPRSMPAPAASEVMAKRAEEQQTAAEVSAFQTAFRIPGRVSVATNEGAKSLRISTAAIAPELAVRAAPVLDPTAFLEASFTQNEDAPLLPGRISIYRDGMFVGAARMAAAGKDEAVRLTPPRKMTLEQAIAYIDEDELVEVTPKSIRLRKRFLHPEDRKRARKQAAQAAE